MAYERAFWISFLIGISLAVAGIIGTAFVAAAESEPETPADPPVEAAQADPPFMAGVRVYGPVYIQDWPVGEGAEREIKWRMTCRGIERWTYLLPEAIEDFTQFPRPELVINPVTAHYHGCTAPTSDAMTTSQSYAAMILVRHKSPSQNDYHGKGHVWLFFSSRSGAEKFNHFREELGKHYQ